MNWLNAIKKMKLPPLVQGSHGDPKHGLCAMEMVAFMECLPHTDQPECTCQTIRGFVICINDTLDDKERQKLLPVLPELVDTVVPEGKMFEREKFIMDTAKRNFDWHFRGQHDYERDRFRGMHHGSALMEEAHRFLGEGIPGAVKLMMQVVPPWHLADVLISMLRGALDIGRPQTKTEFKKPARVKELAKVTYLPQEKMMAQKAMMKIPYDIAIVKDKQFFAIDCVA